MTRKGAYSLHCSTENSNVQFSRNFAKAMKKELSDFFANNPRLLNFPLYAPAFYLHYIRYMITACVIVKFLNKL